MYYRELEKMIADSNVSPEELSQLMGINSDELSKKLKGESEFTLWEIKCITEIFSLKKRQIMHIFFDEKFPKGNNLSAG